MSSNKIIETDNLQVDNSNPGTEAAIQNPDATSVEYKPQSQVCNTVDTVSPVQLMYDMNKALTEINRKVGGVDLYITEKLGYNSFIEVCHAFGAEQVDAIAVGIYNIETKGQASITGDGTGVGKGRVAAGIARYVRLQKKIPLFFTKKPDLFTDFYRDIINIGSDEGIVQKYLVGEREVNRAASRKEIRDAIMEDIDNGDFELDYDTDKLFKKGYEKQTADCIEEYRELYYPADMHTEPVYKRNPDYEKQKRAAKASFEPFIVNARGKKTSIKDANGNIIYQPLDKITQAEIFKSQKLPKGFDCVLCTYSQIRNLKTDSVKADFLRAVGQDSVVILDEAHAASGDSNTGLFFVGGKNPETKKETTGLLEMVWGAHFLSATFAKRPDNMPLYAKKTAIADAGLNKDQLVAAILMGGVPLQEIMASNLVTEGQMLRREKSYEGVEVNYIYLDESMDDPDNNFYNPSFNLKQAHLATCDNATRLLRAIIQFQLDHVEPVIEKRDEDIAEEQMAAEQQHFDVSAGINNTPVFNGIFNLMRMLLLSISAEAVADWAIMRMQQGKKPVIAGASTMESFLDYLLSSNDGEDTVHTDFSVVFKRRLLATLKYTVTYPNGETERTYLNPDEQSAAFRDAYYKLMDDIEQTSLGISISPLDVIKNRIEAAGYTYGEVTGRHKYVQFVGNGRGIIKSRPRPSNTDLFRKFNNNEIDCLYINQTGAEGESAHAFKTAKVNKVSYDAGGNAIIPTSLEPRDEVKQRVMIVLEPELDIYIEVQKRGRVLRTGGIFRPIYDYVASAVPAVMRYMMMMQRKLKSLDANTTSNAKQSKKVLDIVDFFNRYGDRVVVDYMIQNPEINKLTGNILKFEGDQPGEDSYSIADAAHRVSGRVAILDSRMQEDFYTTMNNMYLAYVQKMKDEGLYNLETEYIDLKAKTLSSQIVEPPTLMDDGRRPSIFADGVYLEKCECQNLRKPYTQAEVEQMVKNAQTIDTSAGVQQFTPDELVKYHIAKFKSFADNKYTNDMQDAQLIMDRDMKAITASRAYLLLEDEQEKKNFINERKKQIQVEYDNRTQRISQNNDSIRNKVINLLSFFYPLRRIEYPLLNYKETNDTVSGICLGIDVDYAAKNPFAPSAMVLRIVLVNSLRQVSFALSDSFVTNIQQATEGHANYKMKESIQSSKALLARWNEATKESRADKVINYIITGNLLKALGDEKYRENGTRIIRFSTSDGRVRSGVWLRSDFSPADLSDVVVPIIKAAPIILREGEHMYFVKNSKVSIARQRKYWVLRAANKGSDKIYLDTEMNEYSTHQWEQKRRGEDWQLTIEGDKNMSKIIELLDSKYHFKIALPPNVFDAWKDRMGYAGADEAMQRNEASGQDGTQQILQQYNNEYSEYERNRQQAETAELMEKAIEKQPEANPLTKLQLALTKIYLALEKEAKKREAEKMAQGGIAGTTTLTDLETKRLRYYLNKYKKDNATMADKKEIVTLVKVFYPKLNFTDWGKKNVDYYIKKHEQGNMKDYEYNTFADVILTEFEDAIFGKKQSSEAQLAKVREEHKNLSKHEGDRTAVIVSSNINGPALLGVQYWTEEMIKEGVSTNTDGTKSYLYDYL